MQIYIHTFGCKLNQAESEEIKNKLIKKGWEIIASYQKADVCIINACSVTHGAEQGNRQTIRKIKRKNPNCFIIATGCLREKIPEIDLFIKDKNKIITKLNNIYPNNKTKQRLVSDYDSKTLRTRACIKIQTGCDNFCAYCIIPYLRGKPKSVSYQTVIKNIQEKEKQQFKEIILTGVNICKYQYKNKNLTDLTKLILKKTNIPRIRFGSLDPNLITDEFIDVFKNKRICPSVHLSLQSGSNSVLKRMNRKYSIAKYNKLIKKFKKISPIFSFTTDIIVGFPGETEKEFIETYELLKKIKFLKIHIFPFSPRPNTPAKNMENQVNQKIKKERLKRLKKIADQERKKIIEKMQEKEFNVLIEEKKDDFWHGFTENYIKIKLKSTKNLKNTIIKYNL